MVHTGGGGGVCADGKVAVDGDGGGRRQLI